MKGYTLENKVEFINIIAIVTSTEEYVRVRHRKYSIIRKSLEIEKTLIQYNKHSTI